MGRSRWIVALVSAAAALCLGWPVLGWRRGEPAPRTAAPPGGPRVIDEAFVREHWGERNGFQYDPIAYFVRSPGVDETWPWSDHPRGEIHFATNERGFREDAPTPREFSGFRVLVAGDSHTDGVVDNHDSLANVAERALAPGLGEPVDVINAGVGYTSPRCYLARLESNLDLDPDVFVVVLYTGNDFAEELALAYRMGTHRSPAIPPEYRQPIEAVAADFVAAYQALNQAYRFHSFPCEGELALALVLESLFAIDARCRAQGIDFLLVLLPTKMDVDDDDDRPAWRAACARLGLDERGTLDLGLRALAAASERGIECLDPTGAMQRADVTLYWKKDHHLGLAGHALLGSLLAERLRAIHARRSAPDPR